MSYTITTLRSSIQDYTENSETTFISHILDFIRSAENRIFKMVYFEFFDGLTSTVMESASGYSIVSVVDDDSYTVTVSGTATAGSVKGGGKIASAGPVTLEN